MDFDSRLSVLTPIAIGRPIEKKSQFWGDYKKAKEIRNKVTHSGKKVSSAEARFVIDTVYRWLAYLGSTIELELALIGLKRYVEENKIPIANGDEAVRLISEYFGRTKAATASINADVKLGRRSRQADIILQFGINTVIVEAKFFVTSSSYQGHLLHSLSSEEQKSDPIEQVIALMKASGITQGALIIFQKSQTQREIPPEFQTVRKYHDGKVYVVFIKV